MTPTTRPRIVEQATPRPAARQETTSSRGPEQGRHDADAAGEQGENGHAHDEPIMARAAPRSVRRRVVWFWTRTFPADTPAMVSKLLMTRRSSTVLVALTVLLGPGVRTPQELGVSDDTVIALERAGWQVVASPLKPLPESPPEPTIRVWSTIALAVVETRVEPSWPNPAFNDTKGTLVLDVWIDESGDVAYVTVVRSIPLNDSAAIDAVRQWKFTPATRGRQPIPVVQEVRLLKR